MAGASRDVDAELVLAQSGRDVRVRAGVDVRVHAQRDAREDPARRRERRETPHLVLALRVELADRQASRPAASSSSVLPTPENTIRSGANPARSAARSSPPETMSAPAPRSPQQAQQGARAVGLERVADAMRDGWRTRGRSAGRPRAWRRRCRGRAACRTAARRPPGRRRRSEGRRPSRCEAGHAAGGPGARSRRAAAATPESAEHADQVGEDLQPVHQVAPGPDGRRPCSSRPGRSARSRSSGTAR